MPVAASAAVHRQKPGCETRSPQVAQGYRVHRGSEFCRTVRGTPRPVRLGTHLAPPLDPLPRASRHPGVPLPLHKRSSLNHHLLPAPLPIRSRQRHHFLGGAVPECPAWVQSPHSPFSQQRTLTLPPLSVSAAPVRCPSALREETSVRTACMAATISTPGTRSEPRHKNHANVCS